MRKFALAAVLAAVALAGMSAEAMARGCRGGRHFCRHNHYCCQPVNCCQPTDANYSHSWQSMPTVQTAGIEQRPAGVNPVKVRDAQGRTYYLVPVGQYHSQQQQKQQK